MIAALLSSSTVSEFGPTHAHADENHSTRHTSVGYIWM